MSWPPRPTAPFQVAGCPSYRMQSDSGFQLSLQLTGCLGANMWPFLSQKGQHPINIYVLSVTHPSVATSSARGRLVHTCVGSSLPVSLFGEKPYVLLRKSRVLRLCAFLLQAKELPPKPLSRPQQSSAQVRLNTSSQSKYFCYNSNTIIIKQLLKIIVKKPSYIIKL